MPPQGGVCSEKGPYMFNCLPPKFEFGLVPPRPRPYQRFKIPNLLRLDHALPLMCPPPRAPFSPRRPPSGVDVRLPPTTDAPTFARHLLGYMAAADSSAPAQCSIDLPADARHATADRAILRTRAIAAYPVQVT